MNSSESSSALTPGQAELLQHFQAITNQTNEFACIRLLQIHNWNLEDAVSFALQVPEFADSPVPQSAPEVRRPSASPAARPQLNSSDSFMSRTAEPSPLSPSSPHSPASSPSRFSVLSRLPGAGLVTGTFKLVRSLTGSALSYWTGDSEQKGPPEQTFLEDLERKYPDGPRWFHGSYAEAIRAGQAAGKMIFVYIHCESAGDSQRFMEDLSGESLRNFLSENFICWLGNFQHSDGYKLSHTLGAKNFPFIALLARIQIPGQVKVRMRKTGLQDPDQLIAELLANIEDQRADEAAQERRDQMAGESQQIQQPAAGPSRAPRASPASDFRNRELEATRQLRAVQDAEYKEALARDLAQKTKAEKERAERKQREEAEKAAEEERERIKNEARRAREDRAASRAATRDRFNSSPEPPAGPGVASFSVRLPNAKKVQRRFNEETLMATVFDWIACQEFLAPLPNALGDLVNPQDEGNFRYQLVSTHPRKIHNRPELSIKQLELGRQILMLVEINNEEEEKQAEIRQNEEIQ